MYDFSTGGSLLALCGRENLTIGKVMILRETELFDVTQEEVLAEMMHSWQIMKESVAEGQQEGNRSMGGLIGGEGLKLTSSLEKGNSLTGKLVGKAAAYAMGVLEVNASMGLIVAAPTAGSSGVIPGVFRAVQEDFDFRDEQMVQALFTAGGIGYLLMRNASVSGAEGGCQAEIGSAAAMASAGLVELMGGGPQQALSAASCALSVMLGLVCDPVGGLVEVPCQKRNAAGASNALLCAQMALSGISSLIPFDEMAQVMKKVGQALPETLRETALGGVAASPTACRLCRLSGQAGCGGNEVK